MILPFFEYIDSRRIKIIKEYKLSHGAFIPEGFESDLGSIPKFLWWFALPNDIKYSSIIHDYEWLLSDYGKYSYTQANKNFYKNSIEMDHFSKWKSFVCYAVLEIVRLYKHFIVFIKYIFNNKTFL